MWIFFPKYVKSQHFWNLCEAICHQMKKIRCIFLFLKILFCFHKMEITFIHNDRANDIYNSFIQSISHKFSRREQGKELSIIVLPGHGTPHNDLLKFRLCNSIDLQRQNVLWTSWIFQNWRYIIFRYLLFCKTPEI
jgi:hypothetical protein